MTYTDLESMITEAVKNPETVATALLDVLSAAKDDYTERDTLSAKVAEQEKKIRDLQDTNAKLFLSITKPDATEPEIDETAELSKNVNEFLKSI